MNVFKSTVVLSLVALLSACVTVTDSRFAKKADPEKAVENYVALSVGYISNGDLPMARKKIERALEINPDSASAHSAMAMYWNERGEPKLAEKEYLIALDLDDEHSPANYHYGRYLMTENNDAKACGYLEKAAVDVNYSARVLAYEDLGLCHLNFQQQSKALDAFEKAWSLDGNSTLSSLNLADIYLQRQRVDIASRWYKRFETTLSEKVLPQNAASLYLGYSIAKAAGRKNDMSSYIFKLKKRFPKSEEYKRFLRDSKRK